MVVAALPISGARAQNAYPEAFRINRDIATLASDAWEGRQTCRRGNDSASAFIAARFDSLRLKPMLGAASSKPYNPFFDPFSTRPTLKGPPVPASCPARNVVGIVRGTDSLVSHEYVVIGAHYDHLGKDTRYSMDPQAGNVVRNGADDNASGTAGMLELARMFAKNPPRRSLIFVAFSAEEWGEIGSAHFVTQRLASTRVVAMVNLDMIGRLRNDIVYVDGAATATEWRQIIERENADLPLHLMFGGPLDGRSDHVSFYSNGIPAVHFTTGEHPDYHAATDDAARINGPGVARIVDFAGRIARTIADRAEPLTAIAPPVRKR